MSEPDKELIIQADGASRGNPGRAAIGVVIKDANGRVRQEISHYIGNTTNNQAEYRALIAGLEEAKRLGAEHIHIRMDSELVVKQIKGSYRVRNEGLKPLWQRSMQLLAEFGASDLVHVPRQHNQRADMLANQALDSR